MNDILITYHNRLNEQKKLFLNKLTQLLTEQGFNIITSSSLNDSISTLKHNARIVSYIVDWESNNLSELEELAGINPDLPIFLINTNHNELDLELSNFKLNLDFLQYDQHLISEDTKRIASAITRYLNVITPPFTKELMRYVNSNKYTFCTPGHMGGTAFTRSPVGAYFHDFFGANTFKADISISSLNE